MKDRVPLYPGRVKLTPVAGQTNVYDLVRADQPQQEGTPLNKASLLTDATAAAIGLSGDPTVNDALYALSQKSSPAEIHVYADIGTTATMSNSNKTLTATIASSGYATFYPNELGDWTVSFVYNGTRKTRNYTLKVIGIDDIYPFEIGATLNDTSWADISTASKYGQASKYWNIGDAKTVTINGTNQTVKIIGFDHDTLTTSDGSRTKAGITFMRMSGSSETLINSMNRSATNDGGWKDSYMRTSVLSGHISSLPADLQAVLKSVNKVTSRGSSSATLVTTSDKLFLLSEVEIYGNIDFSVAGEGEVYAYFKAGNSKIFGSSFWWERSPYRAGYTNFCCVNSSGSRTRANADTDYCVFYAFCV